MRIRSASTEKRAEAGEELRDDRLAEREARAQKDREVGDFVRQLVRHERQCRRDAALHSNASISAMALNY